MPGPPPVFPFGLELSLFPREKLHDRMCHYADQYGSLIQFFVGTDPHPRVLVSDAEAVREIRESGSYMAKLSVLPHDLEYHNRGILFNNDMPVWKERRRAVMHTLMYVKHLRRVAQWTVEGCERREKEWQGLSPSQSVTVPMDQVMMKLALEVVANAAFNSSADRVCELSEQIQEDSRIIVRSVNRMPFLPRWLNHLLYWRAVPRAIAARKRLCGVLEGIAEQRIKDLQQGDTNHLDIIDMLIEAQLDPQSKQLLHAREISFTAFDLLVAGHETTSHTMSWVIRLLAQNPDKQLWLRNKLHAHLQGRSPTFDDLRHLPCLMHVVNETLRLHPTNPLILKRSHVEEKLCGYTIPAGTSVFINTAHLHRNPLYWDRPTEFLPERWENHKVHETPWCAFGMGHRICAGQRFAETEIKTMTAWLFSRYQVDLVAEGEVLTFITMRPDGLKVRLTRL
eukprot:CAMPEP_0177663240 /NCGR_PEP_ID=MMETSP0447-20121125/19801_1 /TAXON_ID=0 /ORGANISM="Stygamoeba regulata, Strain BSH-02190019" /LENGTH=451 /DNA_ID=CAMNT_0019169025 /DNA_START=153 /DNA_END=1511 /DNA_ORIENTATION=+